MLVSMSVGRGGAHGELRDAHGSACSWQLRPQVELFNLYLFIHLFVKLLTHLSFSQHTFLPAVGRPSPGQG